MWYLIGLSALMFDLAFFFPEQCGFLILFSFISLGFVAVTMRRAWIGGFVWGVGIFAPHFSWLLLVMLRNSSAAWWLAAIVYLLVVGYFAVTSGCWLWLASLCPVDLYENEVIPSKAGIQKNTRFPLGGGNDVKSQQSLVSIGWKRALWFIVTTLGYWCVVINWTVRPLGLDGYPFINPLLPLTVYRPFLKCVALVAMMAGRQCSMPRYDLNDVVYCPPVVNRVVNATASWRTDAHEVGKRIRDEFIALSAAHSQDGLYVTPESMYCFRLNYHPEIVALWGNALQPNDDLFIGSVIERAGRYYQAVFWLRKSLIINFYVKKLLTPFVEKMPDTLKTFEPLKQPFLSNTVEFCDGMRGFGAEFFDRGDHLRVIPRICLEFFFCSAHDFDAIRTTERDTWIFVFANDSWFDSHFRNILFLIAVLKANYSGLPVLYSGHFGCHRIIPQGA